MDNKIPENLAQDASCILSNLSRDHDSDIFIEGGNNETIDWSQPEVEWTAFNPFEFQSIDSPHSSESRGGPNPTYESVSTLSGLEFLSGLQLSDSNINRDTFAGLSSWNLDPEDSGISHNFVWSGVADHEVSSANNTVRHSEITSIFEPEEQNSRYDPIFDSGQQSPSEILEFKSLEANEDEEESNCHSFSILGLPSNSWSDFGDIFSQSKSVKPHDPTEESKFAQESFPTFNSPEYQSSRNVDLSSEESDDIDGGRPITRRRTSDRTRTTTSPQKPFKNLPAKIKTRKDIVALLKETLEQVEEEENPDFRPQHRDPERLRLQECIRGHTKILLKIGIVNEETGEPYEIAFLDLKESERFESDKRGTDGPSVDRFEIDLVSTKSKWNKRLAEVFAEDFISSGLYGYNQSHSVKIVKGFLVHLKTTRLRILERQGEDIIDKLDRVKCLARDMRRRSLMNRRRKACETYSHDPAMHSLHVLLCSLPHSVCSGDETAHEGGKVRYAVTTMSWRAPILHYIFRILDRLHLSTRFTGDNRATRGAFPHIRVPSKRKDNRAPPQNLPKNFFDSVYLESLEEHDLVHLKLRPRFTVTFSLQIMRLSERFSRVTNRHTPPLPANDPSLPLSGNTIFLD